MTRDWAGVVAWAKAHPTDDGNTWDGRCEAFVADAGGFTNHFGTATLELAAASRLYLPSQVKIGKAPTGWLYHWAYRTPSENYGHVGYAAPSARSLMASSYATSLIHTALGYITASSYQTKSGHVFLGTSPDHGGQYLEGVPHSLVVPGKKGYVHAALGDSLSSIAAAHHETLAKIESLNPQVKGPGYVIFPGEEIRVS